LDQAPVYPTVCLAPSHSVASRTSRQLVLTPLTPGAQYATARTPASPCEKGSKRGASFLRVPQTLVHQRVELRWDRDHV
jgi:hypothetical protein